MNFPKGKWVIGGDVASAGTGEGFSGSITVHQIYCNHCGRLVISQLEPIDLPSQCPNCGTAWKKKLELQ